MQDCLSMLEYWKYQVNWRKVTFYTACYIFYYILSIRNI
ncbi:hypothetical protein ABVS_1019 [Acinetobacter lwoffii]|nr:hypothetical protein ABVS_1019 [Acinetobacter lwoffii]